MTQVMSLLIFPRRLRGPGRAVLLSAPCSVVSLLRTGLQCRRFGLCFLIFPLAIKYRRDCAAPAARFFCLHPVLLSLSCVPAFSAGDTAPIFFFVLPKKKTVAGGQKKKGALYCRDKSPIQPGFQQTIGAYRASSKGLCASPDAQPLTLAVIIVWWCHCRFHSVRLNGEKAENLLNRPALPRRTTRDSAMPHLPNPTAQTSAAFVRWKGDAAA